MSGIASELEQELEFELEQELEQEGELEQEQELEFELEQELGLAHELEFEHEHEAEHEAFFNHLAAMADRGGRPQALRRIAVAAARQALKGTAKPFPVIEGELEGELEGEYELELEFNPVRRAHLNAMLEHMGHAAAEAATEQEAAEHFLPLIPLVAKFALPLLGKALPFAAKAAAKLAPKILGKVVPNLTRGVANIARTLFRNRSTRPLLHAMPRIARGTITNLGRRVARGGRVTPQLAARTLARQTARTLANPRALAQTYRRSTALDRRYHQQTRRLLGRPSVRPGGAAGGTSPGGGGFASPSGGAPMPGGGCRCQYPTVGAAPIPGVAATPAASPAPFVCPTCGR